MRRLHAPCGARAVHLGARLPRNACRGPRPEWWGAEASGRHLRTRVFSERPAAEQAVTHCSERSETVGDFTTGCAAGDPSLDVALWEGPAGVSVLAGVGRAPSARQLRASARQLPERFLAVLSGEAESLSRGGRPALRCMFTPG